MVAPTVTTGAASSVTPWQAAMAGTITDLGGANVSAWGFQYNTSESGVGASTIQTTVAVSSVPTAMAMTARALLEDTVYYFRAYATNADGTGYGSWVSFTTPPGGSVRVATFTLYRRGTAGTIVYATNLDTNKVQDYSVEKDDNSYKTASILIDNSDSTALVNLLNSSCAQWSGSVTGALVLGDHLKVEFTRPGTSTKDQAFYGKIKEIKNVGSGSIQVIAWSGLKAMDKADHGRPVYANYRDHGCYDLDLSNAQRRMTGFTDNNVLLERAAVALTDVRKDLSSTGSPATLSMYDDTEFIAEPIIPEGNALAGIRIKYETSNYSKAGSTSKMILEIRPAKSDGLPSATVIATVEAEVGANDAATYMECSFCSGGVPTWWVPGLLHFIYVRPNITPTNPAGYLRIHVNDPPADYVLLHLYKKTNGGAVEWGTSSTLTAQVDQANYEDLDIEECAVDETNNVLVFPYDDSVVSEADNYYTIYRGMTCHYYNTVTLETIVTNLIERSNLLDADVSANLDLTKKVFDPRGRNLLECVRELLDLFETAGSWSGYQHTIEDYLTGGSVWTAKVGKRLKTTDTVYQILSHPDDTVNDWERFIEGAPQLKRTTDKRYAAVRVVGEDPFSQLVVATHSDEGAATSLSEALPEGFTEVLEVSQGSISDQEANDQASALLDSVNRSGWEGQLNLTGHHPLWVMDTTSDNFGSGRIITLNWSPLGISSVEFYVRSIILHPTFTEIYVSNRDPFLDRAASKIASLSKKVNQSDNNDTVCVRTYKASVISATSGWMQLEDSSGVALLEQERVPCVVYTNNQNMKIFAARFPSWNGLGTVEQVEVFTAITGGSSVVVQDLYRTASSITVDERQDKRRGDKALIELQCKAT